MTLSLYFLPNEVNSSIMSSMIFESKFKGIGPRIRTLGFHPVAISASKE